MKRKKQEYKEVFPNIEKFIEWYISKNKEIKWSIEEVLQNVPIERLEELKSIEELNRKERKSEASKKARSNVKKGSVETGQWAARCLKGSLKSGELSKEKSKSHKIEILKGINNEFTGNELKDHLKSLNLKEIYYKNIIADVSLVELIYKGRSGSKYDVNIYKKKQNI
jgi:hypothetical protein